LPTFEREVFALAFAIRAAFCFEAPEARTFS
jgi:hypothetical protein